MIEWSNTILEYGKMFNGLIDVNVTVFLSITFYFKNVALRVQ